MSTRTARANAADRRRDTPGARPPGGDVDVTPAEEPDREPIVARALSRPFVPALLGAAAVVCAAAILLTGLSPALLIAIAIVACGVVLYVASRVIEGHQRAADRTVTYAIAMTFAVAVLPLFSVLWTVVSRGLDRFDVAFFTESARNVVGEGGGAQHAIVGTLIITGCATLAAVPVGVLAGIYLEEYGRGKLKAALTFFVDVMTGIPSIVAGLFAYAVFVLIFGPGIRLGIMGSVALFVLMVPIVIRSTEEMLKIVPDALRESALALGVPKWRVVTRVVLPTALAGIITGVMLAVARIVGETAPLLVTTGVFSSVNTNPLHGRMQNLPVFAYSEYSSPGVPPDPYFARAWAAALVLLLFVMALNLAGRLVHHRFGTDLT